MVHEKIFLLARIIEYVFICGTYGYIVVIALLCLSLRNQSGPEALAEKGEAFTDHVETIILKSKVWKFFIKFVLYAYALAFFYMLIPWIVLKGSRIGIWFLAIPEILEDPAIQNDLNSTSLSRIIMVILWGLWYSFITKSNNK